MNFKVLLALAATATLFGQVTSELLLNSSSHPENWLTYSGSYFSQRYSALDKIKRTNVKDLELKWVWRPRYLDKMEGTPLVVNGILYTVQGNQAVALDARTGRAFWTFEHQIPPESNAYLLVVKGLAISGNTLFWATYDGHLIAIDAKNGHALWDKVLVDWHKGLQLNVAPLVVKDKVILGPATNEYGVNCWIAAYDVHTGKELWRFNTTPGADEPGRETWPGESWKHGGGSIWVTGSYDPQTNLTFWGTGNPNPGWNGDPRAPGDNLYGDSVVALDADTGKLKWYYQFTPGDEFDWDAVQVPVLAQIDWQGQQRKVMLWANRNGFYYVLDRVTGKFLLGKAFVKQNWNVGFDEKGRPMKAPDFKSSTEGTFIQPSVQGGTNWYSPSFSPRTQLFYVSSWQNGSQYSAKAPAVWKEGERYTGVGRLTGARARPPQRGGGLATGGYGNSSNFKTEEEGYGALIAIVPQTGEKKWEYKMVDFTESGVLSTASDLVFGGGREGNFFALDARDGTPLWHTNLGGTIASGPMTYAVNGKQYVAVCGGSALYVFSQPD